MKNKKILALICCVSLSMGVAVSGCGSNSSTDTAKDTTTASSDESEENTEADTNDNAEGSTDASDGAEEKGEMPQRMEADIYGKITAIDGNVITIALAEQPTMPDDAGEAPTDKEKPADGEAPTDDEKPADGEAPTDEEKPADGEAPTDDEKPADGEAPSGRGEREVTLTGEETTITVEDTTTINEDGTIADLAVDDIVSVMMDNETVTSITTGGGFKGGDRPEDVQDPSTAETEDSGSN